jgi:muconolactone D-isomerase
MRAKELREAGILIRLWRVPGTRDAIGLYEAEDATVLHDALSSLPLFPWLEISVQPLATHPQEQK